MYPENGKIWYNGKLVDWNEGRIHLASHVIHYGTGVFEGIRVYKTDSGPQVFRLREHIRRFFFSAHAYQMAIPYSEEEVIQACLETVRANGFEECYIRPIAFRGYGPLGVHPGRCPVEVAVLTWKWGAYLGEEALTKGVRVTITGWRKFHGSMMPTTAKACGQYLNSVLGVQEARQNGYDEAIFLDVNGYLAEGSGENLFLVLGDQILTNGSESSILLGITRDAVIQMARALGYQVQTRLLVRGDLYAADEAFFTGTAAEITPIREVDGRVIGTGEAGPVTRKLQSLFFEIVRGKRPEYRHWLTPVYG
ncbi:MAG: branched-chain amino acid transaminase [candidate division KSB1 bacterium]|nr:branched-chain amino acid transaminase [candidate division KSB1 bacterium]